MRSIKKQHQFYIEQLSDYIKNKYDLDEVKYMGYFISGYENEFPIYSYNLRTREEFGVENTKVEKTKVRIINEQSDIGVVKVNSHYNPLSDIHEYYGMDERGYWIYRCVTCKSSEDVDEQWVYVPEPDDAEIEYYDTKKEYLESLSSEEPKSSIDDILEEQSDIGVVKVTYNEAQYEYDHNHRYDGYDKNDRLVYHAVSYDKKAIEYEFYHGDIVYSNKTDYIESLKKDIDYDELMSKLDENSNLNPIDKELIKKLIDTVTEFNLNKE